ncbi:MAG: hypothetical protein Q9195_003076 [Heterodermia aff. obscurata]
MTYAPPSPTSTLLSLSRHQVHLENHIQSLLDAQSAGLVSGLVYDEHYSDGTRTPTSTTTHSPARSHRNLDLASPIRQNVSKPLRLQSARRGISHAISDFVLLKSQESEVLQAELEKRRQDTTLVKGFVRKQEGLRSAIEQISSQDASCKVQEFRTEEQVLGREIQELEDRLQQMRNRQRYLLREIQALDNSVQAKLSSYQESLRLAEKEARAWLNRKPAGLEDKPGKKDADGMWALPKERRTLEMAQEWIESEEEKLKARIERVETESEALKEGGKVWLLVRQIVVSVEKGLRGEMRGSEESRRYGKGEGTAREGMMRILRLMETAKEEIESHLNLAEDKGWRLLVCCIGAELEALVEGMGFLRGAADAAEGNLQDQDMYREEVSRHGQSREGNLIGETNGLDEPMNEVNIADTSGSTWTTKQRSEDDDDGPGPDLLVSHQED